MKWWDHAVFFFYGVLYLTVPSIAIACLFGRWGIATVVWLTYAWCLLRERAQRDG